MMKKDGMQTEDTMKKSKNIIKILSAVVLGATLTYAGPFNKTPAELEARFASAELRLQELQAKPGKAIPAAVLANAQGIIIIRKLKVGAGIGAEAGGGVVLVKNNGDWSAPSFTLAAEGIWDMRFGAQDSDIIMVFMTRESLDLLRKEGDANLGIEIQATVGPVDSGADIDTDDFESPIFVYTDAAGGFPSVSPYFCDRKIQQADEIAGAYKSLYI
jgi:lipid-binding SYLF domain-containing protein